MGKTLTILHTTPVTVSLLAPLVKEIIPEGTAVRNLVDDSLLNDTRKAGGLTKEVTRRLVAYVQHAEAYGTDLLLLACSSVGPALDVARGLCNMKTLKIDEPMAEEAVKRGNNLAVIATVSTTLAPTKALVMAAKPGVHVDTVLCEDAFAALSRGDVEGHNRLLMGNIERAAETHDAVILAQASMTNILPALCEGLRSKVLTSPRLGLLRAAEILSKA